MRSSRVDDKKKKWSDRLHIRTRLILLTFALAVPFLAYFVVSSVQEAALEREQAGAQMLGAAKVTAARLDDYIGDIRQLLFTLASVVDPVAADTSRNDELLKSLVDKLPEHINNLSVWAIDGANVGTIDSQLRDQGGANVAKRSFFLDAMSGTGLAVEAPAVAISNGASIGIFAAPIVRHGKVVGVVSASTKLPLLQSLLVPVTGMPDGTLVAVTNQSGVVLARSIDAEKWIGKSLKEQTRVGVDEAMQPREGVREGSSVDGIDRLAGFAPTRRVPWTVYVGVPRNIALAPVYARGRVKLLMASAILLIGLVLAAQVGKSISVPLQKISEDAAKLGQGELTHRLDIPQQGEIGLLAATLNQMAAALQKSTVSLQRSQEQLRLITDNMPAMISYLDGDQRFRFANKVHHDWMGVLPEKLLGMSLSDFYGDTTYQELKPHMDAALVGTRVVYEFDLKTAAGVRRLEMSVVPHLHENGDVQGLFVLATDVSVTRKAEAERALSEERLSLALEASNLALFDWDVESDKLYHSAQAAAIRGEEAHEETISPLEFLAMVHPDDQARLQEQVEALITDAAVRYDIEFRVRTRSGGWTWLRGRGRVVERDSAGRPLRIAGTYADITERKEVERKLRHMAEYDALTGLPNRALFQDRLQQAVARAQRAGNLTALLFLDVDHFKQVNDEFGHDAGDEVLKTFAGMLKNTIRESDTVARLAGDEFTVILEGMQRVEDAIRIAESLVSGARRDLTRKAERTIKVSVSVGIAILDPSQDDPQAWLQRADAALYQAKRNGRDGYSMASTTLPRLKYSAAKIELT